MDERVSDRAAQVHADEPRPDGRGFARFRRRGFSIIEVVIVAVMLAIVAATIVPRFAVANRQIEEKAVLEVEDLLRMYAFRNSAGPQQISLYYDGVAGEVSLWIKDLDPSNPEGPRVWQQDRLSSPVELPTGMGIVEALADGISMREDPWNIPTLPDGSRPRIELVLAGADVTATLVLDNYTVTPVRVGDKGAVVREQVDLDAQGAGLEPW
jgi:prepilin-type N-terminal cleavage/methylation domain-containing protein